MVRIFKALRTAALTCMVMTGTIVSAGAAPIVSVDPVTQTVPNGSNFFVDILISGLSGGEEVGGFKLDLGFDSSVIVDTGYTIGSVFGAGPHPLDDSAAYDAGLAGTGSIVGLYFTSLLAPGDLVGMTSYVLARVNFTAVSDGVSPLDLNLVDLSDGLGLALLVDGEVDGQVCVGTAPCPDLTPVPEPATLTLLGAGLAAAVARRRHAAAKRSQAL